MTSWVGDQAPSGALYSVGSRLEDYLPLSLYHQLLLHEHRASVQGRVMASFKDYQHLSFAKRPDFIRSHYGAIHAPGHCENNRAISQQIGVVSTEADNQKLVGYHGKRQSKGAQLTLELFLVVCQTPCCPNCSLWEGTGREPKLNLAKSLKKLLQIYAKKETMSKDWKVGTMIMNHNIETIHKEIEIMKRNKWKFWRWKYNNQNENFTGEAQQ